MQVLAKLSDFINKFVEWFLFLTIAIMTFVISIQIIFRVFFTALSWSEELARYLLVWSSFLGASVAVKRGAHIAVSFLVERLQGGAARIVRYLTLSSMEIFFLIGGFYGIKLIQRQVFQISPALRIPMRHVYLIIPISMFIMFFHTFYELISHMKRGDE